MGQFFGQSRRNGQLSTNCQTPELLRAEYVRTDTARWVEDRSICCQLPETASQIWADLGGDSHRYPSPIPGSVKSGRLFASHAGPRCVHSESRRGVP